MSLKLQWKVLRSNVPHHLKGLLQILALIAKDDGSGIYVRTDKLAGYLGVHRVTASRLMQELVSEDLVQVLKRGGRWQGTDGKVRARSSVRLLNVEKLEALGRIVAATRSSDLVALALHDASDLVAAPLHDASDLVALALPIKTVRSSVKTVEQGQRPSNRKESQKTTTAAPPSIDAPVGSSQKPSSVPERNVSGVTGCLNAFRAAFTERFPDKRPLIQHGKDQKLLAQLIAAYGEPKVLILTQQFFASTDPKIVTSNYMISTFYANAQRLVIGPRPDRQTAENIDAVARACGQQEDSSWL